MTITRYGAKTEAIGASYVGEILRLKVKLLELYDDGSGKVGDVLELPLEELEADEGIDEMLTAAARFTTLKEKEETMRTSMKNVEGQSLGELVTLYNKMVPPKQRVKKFRDRQTAVRRLTDAFAGGRNKPKKPERRQSLPAPRTAAAAQHPASAGIQLVGRKSSLSGMYLYKLTDKNPRREGTHGWASWNALKNGMTYEKFILAHGGAKHLSWDIEHGYVEARKQPK